MVTNYFLNCVAGNLFKSKTNPALPTGYYIGLSSTAPNKDGGGVKEPGSGTGYARVQLTGLSEPVLGVVTNNSAINFKESTAGWGTMTHYVIYNALSGGDLLMYGALSAQRTVETATVVSIKPGSLKLTVKDSE